MAASKSLRPAFFLGFLVLGFGGSLPLRGINISVVATPGGEQMQGVHGG